METIVGFITGLIASIVRAIVADFTARKRLEKAMRAQVERDALVERIRDMEQSRTISDKIDTQNLGAIIDGL